MAPSVDALLNPRSVAIIGASADPLKRGLQTIRRLQLDGFPHPIYPVNPKLTEVLGLTAYPNVEAIDGEVDLALLVTPAPGIPDALRGCGRKGVGAAVIVAVGFGESGEEGRALEREVTDIAAEYDIALVGPNTNGLFHLGNKLNLVGVSDVPQGGIGLIAQSGNVGISLFAEAGHHGALGFSSYVGIGNEAGVRFHQVLERFAHDPTTDTALVYAEGFRDGRSFLATTQRVAADLPVVVYKAGRSEAGQRSAVSHTGAVAGSPQVARSLLRQAGAIVVERSDELLATCEALTQQPPMAGGGVAVLADGGGHATMAVDALSEHGLELASLTHDTHDRLEQLLPAAASHVNPVDLAGASDRDPSVFHSCLEILLDDPDVGAVLCVGLFGGYAVRFSDDLADAEVRTAEAMAATAHNRAKPLVMQSVYASARPQPLELLRKAGVPVHDSVERATACLDALRTRGRWQADADQHPTLDLPRWNVDVSGSAGPVRTLTEPEGRALLADAGFDLDPVEVVTDADAAADAVERLGPAACKVVSSTITHKSDIGGVLLDVTGADSGRAAFQLIHERVVAADPDATVDGVLVAPMAAPGLELFVGATVDPSFGPLVTVGAGGVHVEALPDVAFRAAPISANACHEMLDELTIAPLLLGVRGERAIDRDALVTLLQRVSDLMIAHPEIRELDLNPTIARPDGLTIVDVRVVVAPPNGATGGGPDHGRGASLLQST